jgi:RNA polymerase sigma-B factor
MRTTLDDTRLDDSTVADHLRAMHAPDVDDERRRKLRREVVEHFLPRAVRIARRFHDRGEPQRDLDQVAAVGLLKAVDGYDPERGVPFVGYLVPTVLGELKRHFRDAGWGVRVPRRLQELRLEVGGVTEDLTRRLGHEPAVGEIARELGRSDAEVRTGLLAARAYESRSLNEPLAGRSDGDVHERQDLLGGPDHHLEQATDRVALEALLRRLPRREAHLLALRFFDDLSQAEIGDRLGISQMQVSRLLGQLLGWLRTELDGRHQRMPFDTTPRLRLRLVATGRSLVARLQGPLGPASVPQLQDRLVHATVHLRPARLTLDLRRVTELTPHALAAIVAAQRACGHVHGRLVLVNARPAVAATVRRGGLGRLLAGRTPAAGLTSVGTGHRPDAARSTTGRRRPCWSSSPRYPLTGPPSSAA